MIPSHRLFPAAPASPPAPLALAIRTLCAGGVLFGAAPARGELPVPADVLVAPGAGNVLPPMISGSTMTIRQLSDKATLDWKSFNIGAENTVRFQQPSSTSVALNNIHQADPSRIYGTLTANGQVYLVNQNGFVFGRNARINVNSLVATTLNISQEAFQLGITQAFDQNRLPALSATDANGQPIRELYLKDASGQPVLDRNGQRVKIQIFVEAGARLETSSRDGRIILAAPSITNEGTIEAPDGQVILAASQDRVYLQQADADSGIRGLLVEVGTGGDVNNLGKIIAERGNASLIGFAVNQQGRVSATTSVKLNGSVRLLAREGTRDPIATNGALRPAATRRGQDLDDGLGTSAGVRLGKGSLTSVELDADKAETAVDAQAQARSRIELAGHKVFLESGSTVRAKSGSVQVTAMDDPSNPGLKGDSRIHLDSGSRIDVSGVKNVVLPMERNIVKVELRSNELRDSPLQRNGVLHGKTIAVDLRRVGADGRIPIADLSGALDRIARNIDERSTAGGDIALDSSGDVVTRQGSVLDFSGGSVAYRDGYLRTTQLLSNGRIFDIAEADPNRRYEAILGDLVKFSPKWGITQRWSFSGPGLKRFEPGYVEGKAGGSLSIAAFNALLDGVLQGKTVAGPGQRLAADQAVGSSLSIDLNKGNLLGRQDVVFAPHAASNLGPRDPFPVQTAGSAAVRPLELDPALLKASGIHKLTLKTNGALRIENGVRIVLPENGGLDLAAAGFDVQGSIIALSGEVNLHPVTITVDGGPVPLPSAITLGAGAEILAGGEWVNDVREPGRLSTVALDGGRVSLLTEQGDLTLQPGSRIDVSGGAWLKSDGTLAAGQGGSIRLAAATKLIGAAPSNLVLGGQLSGWGLEQGGSLGLTSGEVVIGPNLRQPDPNLVPLVLAPDFFQQGGFADYDISSNFRGLTVTDGTRVRLLQRNRTLFRNAATLPSADSLLDVSQAVTLPDTVRKPASLKLSLAQTLAQNRQELLAIGQGASLETDPEGRIALSSDTSIRVEGTLKAPGGVIDLRVTPPAAVDSGFFASQGIWLGTNSRLLAPGVFDRRPDGTGLVTGEVLAGGTVSLTASRGYIVTGQGSLIDVSGTSAALQFREPSGSGPGWQIVSRNIPSAGGRIALAAGEGLIADGDFRAAAGGQGVAGGALAVELNGLLRAKPADPIPGGAFPDEANPAAPRTLVVSASGGPFAPPGLSLGGSLPSGQFSGKGFLSADGISAGGFGSISLKTDAFVNADFTGRIEFRGDVQLGAGREIVLDSPTLAWSRLNPVDTGQVDLQAPRVALGSTQSRIDIRQPGGDFSTVQAPAARGGEGRLKASGKGLDLVGGLSFDGFGQAELESAGDVRAIGTRTTSDTKNYLGELKIAGDLTLKARQVYPATLTDYRISVGGPGRTLSIVGNGPAPATLYSAGGSLSLEAPSIVQAGVLRAPFGSLALNATDTLQLAAGSLTSVSGAGASVPFGRGSAGLYWLYPLDVAGINNRVIATPPEKRIVLNGRDVDLVRGARVDLSGGGDLYGYEFITGPGGSNDVLNPADPAFTPKFAVIPGIYGIATPYDPSEFPASGLRMGDSVYLSGGAGLAEGWYTLLPAHYALLPGAWLVTPEAGTRDLAPGQGYSRLDGAMVVAGRYGVAGTSTVDPRWQGFAVEPGSIARTRSEFQDYSANRFFADQAERNGTVTPQLPRDAGGLAVSADARLALGAELAAAGAAGGTGGQVDINAARLAILGRREDLASLAAGVVGLLAEDLNRLNVPSLLLGGLRSKETTGQRVEVVSDSVEVAGNANLSGQEILLAARNQVKISSGAVLASTGRSESPADDLLVSNRVASGARGNSDGALVRVSALGQVDLSRDQPVTGSGGVLIVEVGARLASEHSILLDSSQDTRFAGTVAMQGGSLALKSSKISLGEALAGTSGLVLADTGFDLDELRLISATDLNLYGGVTLDTQRLFIDAAAINGYGGAAATINAEAIRLGNATARSAGPGDGGGELNLNAETITLGSGQYAISGFRQVNLNAGEALLGQTDGAGGDAGRLAVAGDLHIRAGHVSGGAGATTSVDAGGHQIILEALAAPAEPADTTGPGVRWNLTADAIAGTARFDLPSGVLDLTALRGDVRLDAGTVVDVAGQAQTFGSLTRYTDAGSVRLEARQGNVVLASGANLNLSGAESSAGSGDLTSHAGSLSVLTPQGGFDWSGTVTAGASAGSEQGRFALDADDFGAGGFAALNSRLAAAGFTEALELRQRRGDVRVPEDQTVRAHRFTLAADTGAVTLAGRIDASGTQGGAVSIQGSGGVALGAGASIDAHATGEGGKGGRVILDSVASDLDSTGSGLLDLAAASSIDVAGGAGGEGGSVQLRTGRDENTGELAVTAIDSQIRGSARAVLEAARVYTGVSTIDADAIAAWQRDTAAFMAIARAPADHSGANLILAPGLDIRNTGDLTLASSWDFMAKQAGTGELLWRWQGVPGHLRLAAGGDLNIAATLTDGFATAPLPDPLYGTLQGIRFQDTLQPGWSWSYTLSAGGDVRLASSYQARDPATGAAVNRQVMVRTGTGTIAIQAGRDLRFLSDPARPKLAAAVYTLGQPADYTFDDLLLGRIPGLVPLQPDEDLAAYLQRQDPAVLAAVLRWGTFSAYHTGYGFLAEYPTRGGDIELRAGGDIVGVQTGQLASDWLVRSGTWNSNPADAGKRPTAWGVDVSGGTADRVTAGVDENGNPVLINEKGRRFFNQNVGALGGGDVSVRAGGEVRDLSVMIPTTGKPMGILTTPRNGGRPDLRVPDGATDSQWLANGTAVSGGGDLEVRAGGDIRGGEYYTGRGTGRLIAGDSIAAADSNLGTVVGLGEARFELSARKDVVLGTALNPTLLPQQDIPDSATRRNSFFFTYAPDSGLNLISTAGHVVLQNDIDTLRALKGYTAQDGTGFELAVFPGTLTAVAPAGDIRIDRSLNLYPTRRGQLEWLAGENIGTNRTQDSIIKLNLSDADPALLPRVELPEAGLLGDLPRRDLKTRERLDPESPLASAIHAVIPVHEGDPDKVRIIAARGDIAFPGGIQMKLFLPKATEVLAGRDIRNLSLYIQNLAAGDISRISAGRDLLFDSRLDANGGVVPLDQRIELAGPGRLQVLAGRNVNLGSSSGILTIGNLFNRALSGEGGAAIDLLAGLSDRIDYGGFIDKYLTVGSSYLAELKPAGVSDDLTPEEKLARIRQLPDEAKLVLIQDILFSEIRQSAFAAASAPETQRFALYQRGFEAIETLFPGEDYQGDLALVFSQIKTLSGGDINLAVPGGQIDVGLAGTVGGIRKDADQLGIVAQQQGSVNAFVRGDFNVNQSRVFTLGGGNIVVWSSEGDIDAGKGAKSAISAPPPITGVDENGNLVTIFPPIVSGSGIQAVLPSDQGQSQGSVYLAAPKGVVDAGEAGISGGQVVIAANAVIGASNIQASGGTVGVPTAVAPPVVPAGVANAAAGAAKAATQAGGLDDGDRDKDKQAGERRAAGTSLLSADVVGYGQCSVADVRDGKPGCGG